MIPPDSLIKAAFHLLLRFDSDEAVFRRAVSTAYYGLFHTLCRSGGDLFRNGGVSVGARVSRAFNHGPMREACKDYIIWCRNPAKAPFDTLIASIADPRLLDVAEAFVTLQERRMAADYDLSGSWNWSDAFEHVATASSACEAWRAIQHLPEATAFLAALLLSDRWTRRG